MSVDAFIFRRDALFFFECYWKRNSKAFQRKLSFPDKYGKASIKRLGVYLIFTPIGKKIYIYICRICLSVCIFKVWGAFTKTGRDAKFFLLSLREIFVKVQYSFAPFSRVRFVNFLSFSQFLIHNVSFLCFFAQEETSLALSAWELVMYGSRHSRMDQVKFVEDSF